MGGNKIQTLEGQIKKTCEPIMKRREHYATIALEVRTPLLSYFLDAGQGDALIERPQQNQCVFLFKDIKDSLEACLVDEVLLVETAQNINPETPSLVAASDHCIKQAKLPLVLEKNGYCFKPATPYTPKAQRFMEQFASALSVYRVYLGICDVYCFINRHHCLNLDEYNEILEQAQQFKSELEPKLNDSGEQFLNKCWQDAKKLKGELNELSKKIQRFSPEFENKIQFETAKISQLFEQGAYLLNESYKKFPNESILWLLVDEKWQTLLKTLAAKLYFNQYSASAYSGALTINTEFTKLVNQEITDYYTAIMETLPLLKGEILREAFAVVNQSITDLKLEAAHKGIQLLKAPENGFFSPGIYSGMLSILRQEFQPPSVNGQNEPVSEYHV
ncbi:MULTISPECIES: hypothetical protein [unclassified Legionella]|uniref:hypothetical protein n=1 Tax=unclassified Legionella TaxID=2622702 RepID=UPI001055101C|nr:MULTISPECIES: hypothetical protein [unclassified Legionella]MDI9819535.1 hypothetical protein [Legionella sp. PL877]